MKQAIKDQLVAHAVEEFKGLLEEGIDDITEDMDQTFKIRNANSESGLSGFKYNVSSSLTIEPSASGDAAALDVQLSWGVKKQLKGETRHIDDQEELPNMPKSKGKKKKAKKKAAADTAAS